MDVCQECASMSRDNSGICAGCGAPWPLTLPVQAQDQNPSNHPSPLENLPRKISSFGLIEPRPKQVWIAILLAFLAGPIGLAYCSQLGAIVMLLASILLTFALGNLSFLMLLIIQPLCMLWAWIAARDLSSSFDIEP